MKNLHRCFNSEFETKAFPNKMSFYLKVLLIKQGYSDLYLAVVFPKNGRSEPVTSKILIFL